jgi:hypothetical protein
MKLEYFRNVVLQLRVTAAHERQTDHERQCLYILWVCEGVCGRKQSSEGQCCSRKLRTAERRSKRDTDSPNRR